MSAAAGPRPEACEVAVVGAGMLGACTAWELAARGVDVLLLDAGEVSGETTGLGEGNVLCGDKDAGPGRALAVLGLARYAAVEAAVGPAARIRRKGSLLVHPDPATWAAEPARVARLRAAGVAAELLGPTEARAAEPLLTGELAGAARFPDDLQCAPRAIARALAGQVARVRTGCRVRRVALAGGRVAGLDTDGGPVAADAVVLAAGPWSAALAEGAGLTLPLEPRWGQLVELAVGPRAAEAPPLVAHKVVDGSYLAAVAAPEAGLRLSTVVETTWDGNVVVGSSRARRGFDTRTDPAVAAGMRARAQRLMPALAGLRAARTWAGLRPWLPDHRPALGASRRVPGLWLATGHEGAGVGLGPISGRLVAQAICGEPPDLPLAPFRPDRFAAAAEAATD